jgi:undecaprenyl-diphosphatase
LIHADKKLEHWIVAHRVRDLNWLFLGLSRVGTLGLVWIAIAIVLAVVWRRPWLVVPVVVAVLGADALAALGKQLVHRHRPFEHQIGPSERTHSFPSGHSASAFAGATMLAHYAPRYRPWFYVLAVLIAFSRLYNGVHYPTDVVVGSLLGVATALLLLAAIRRRRPRGSRRG